MNLIIAQNPWGVAENNHKWKKVKEKFSCGIIYVANQMERTFTNVSCLKSLANVTQTIDTVGKFITDSSPGAVDLAKKFSAIRKIINPLQFVEFVNTFVFKERREEFCRQGTIKQVSRIFLGLSSGCDVVNLLSWLGIVSTGTATVKVFGVVASVSVLSIKSGCVVIGCFLGMVDSIMQIKRLHQQRDKVTLAEVYQVLLAMAANAGKVACTIFAGPEITIGFMALSIGTGVIVLFKLFVDNHVRIRREQKKQREISSLNEKIVIAQKQLAAVDGKDREQIKKLVQERDALNNQLSKIQNRREWVPTPIPA